MAEPGLIIDLFAGGGGASQGIFEATGRHPDVAVNHDPQAIALHAANHPDTLHLQDDIRKVDIAAVLARFPGRTVDLLWASPDCKHHSKARGGKPKDKNIRGLAWEVLRWSAAIKRATGALPRVISLENVEEFQDWCPVHRYGRKAGTAMKHRKGETFRLWIASLKSLGFARIEWRELVAADHGDPTTRKRLFLQARSDGLPIRWPEKTHAPRGKAQQPADLFDDVGFGGLKPYRSAAECIDWDRPIPSIFGRRARLKPKTEARIAKGIKRYVIEAARPFIVPITHTKGFNAARSADEPLRTITTAKGGEFAVSAPTILPLTHAGGEERVYDVEDPMRTVTSAPRGETALASATLMAPAIMSNNTNNTPKGVDAPLPTVTTGNRNFVQAAFLKPRYGEREGQEPRALDVEGPMPTVVPTGNGANLVAPILSSVAYGDDRERAGLRAWPVDGPVRTVTGSNDLGIGAAYLGRQFGTAVGRDLERPHPTVMTDGAGGKSQLVAAHISRQFGKSAGADPTDPALTVTGKAKDALTAAYMAQHNGGKVGRAVDDPVSTLTSAGRQQQLVAPLIDKYYGAGVAAEVEDPLDTVTATDRFGLGAAYIEQANTGMVGRSPDAPLSTIVGKGCTQRLVEAQLDLVTAPEGSKRRDVLDFLWAHFGAPTAEEWADPTATAQARLRFGLVILDGVVWQIVDIGMRMLTPRELFRAQGFPDSYVIDIAFEGRPLTKTAQTRMAGNSVCPGLARAIVSIALDFDGLEAWARSERAA